MVGVTAPIKTQFGGFGVKKFMSPSECEPHFKWPKHMRTYYLNMLRTRVRFPPAPPTYNFSKGLYNAMIAFLCVVITIIVIITSIASYRKKKLKKEQEELNRERENRRKTKAMDDKAYIEKELTKKLDREL